MELPYANESLPKIDKRLFLLVTSITIGATFALWQAPIPFAGLLIAVVFLVGVYHIPELGIAVLVNGLYLVGLFWKGFQITYLVTPLAVMLCFVGLVHYVLNRGPVWRFGTLPGMVLLIGGLMFVGILYSPLPYEGLVKTGRYLSMNLFIFFATTLFIGDLEKMKNLLKTIALIGFVVAIISAIYLSFLGIRNISRFTLPGQNPIWFARGLGISILATFFWMELTPKKFQKLILVVFICLMMFLTYLTGSRGPFLTLLAVLVFYFFILMGRKHNILKALFFVLLIVFSLKFFITFAPGQIFERMLSLFSRFDISTFFRLRAFETAKNLFFENPIMGVGTGGFGHFNMLTYPHNVLLELASEVGISGVMTFLLMSLYAAYLGIKLIRDKNTSILESNLSKTFFAIFLFSLINSQVSGDIPGNYELWFAMAGIWTLHKGRSGFIKS